MRLFYVFQGDNYKEEKNLNLVFSPQKTKNGSNNKGYSTMTLIKKGDFIFHNANGYLKAISTAMTDCFDSNIPEQFSETSQRWNYIGYRINTNYYELNKPLLVTEYKPWIISNFDSDGPFDKNGNGKQQYMSILPHNYALFLIDKAINIQDTEDSILELKKLKQLILNVINEERELDNYNNLEHQTIEENIDEQSSSPTWERRFRRPEYTISQTTNRSIPKRNPKIAANALRRANFKCEYNQTDRLFLRKRNNYNYTEPHHLIPISKQSDFKCRLDIEENIVSLCSHCHNLIHYGREEDKKIILRKLYNERKQALKDCEIKITFSELMNYYK